MVQFRVKALYEYTSPHEDDLTFEAGQVITVTEEEDDDWYNGEYFDQTGQKREGIFPRNFVEKMPEPQAPPRPTRSRSRKDTELEAPHLPPLPPFTPTAPPPVAPISTAQPGREERESDQRSPVVQSTLSSLPQPKPVEQPATTPVPPPATAPKPTDPTPASPAAITASKPKPNPKSTPPPPVSEKPSSFKDRIAAFNKSAAPPVAPFKPTGLGSGGAGGSFIKKPFVAPPPSRNAYVPTPHQAPISKIYRRDEDPEIKEKEAENQEQAERAGLAPHETGEGAEDGDQPKPTTLKERIALLQQQQREQAARHADAAAKKEKPKKPVKKAAEVPPVPTQTEETVTSPSAPRKSIEDVSARVSTESSRAPPPPRRKPSKESTAESAAESVHDGNEADLSGAGDTTEGQDDTTEREDSTESPRRLSSTVAESARMVETAEKAGGHPEHGAEKEDQKEEKSVEREEEEEQGEVEEDDGEEDDDVDPEVKRKEELRARMAKMSGGMGFHGMFGMAPPVPVPAKKKKTPKVDPGAVGENAEEASRAAPPVPKMIAIPGMGVARPSEEMSHPNDRPSEDEQQSPISRAPPPIPTRQLGVEEGEDNETTPALTPAPTIPTSAPPVPTSRPAPPPVPSSAHPGVLQSPVDGSESGDELEGTVGDQGHEAVRNEAPQPPRLPPAPPHLATGFSPASSSISTNAEHQFSPTSPTVGVNRRNSRPPPPIPGTAPALPPMSSRPPPPPPPGPLSRQSTADVSIELPVRPVKPEENEEEVTAYEGDYDTDIASSVPHKDALKAHGRESSLEDSFLQSPIREAPQSPPKIPPPVPTTAPRAVPPPVPAHPPQSPPEKRKSADIPRAPPPPPPPTKDQDEGDPFNHANVTPGYSHQASKIEEEEESLTETPTLHSQAQSPPARAPPPARGNRQSVDFSRRSMSNRRSVDMQQRPVIESGFIANNVDLAVQSGWWKQANQVPPVLQGRKDIFFESEESTTTNGGAKTVITRDVFVLFQDYSQTIITARYDPYSTEDVELEQRHEPPPRTLRQDQMEEFYERFGRHISEAVVKLQNTVVGDGQPQTLVHDLLRPFPDALRPVGTRAYGALVYSNMANASTQQHDMIRPGDILTIRNARFQGKHGPMHAKYSVEVGKPDHVAVVSEWDGTKKKVRAWEQGRENKKVKVESFKLDDLRSGEVRIWRVVARGWVGWNTPVQGQGGPLTA